MNEFETAMEIWQRSGEAHADLWASHLVVALAVLAFALSPINGRLSRAWQAVLAFLFLNLAIVNAWSIWDNLTLYNAAILQLQTTTGSAAASTPLTDALHRIDADHLLWIHALLDIVVIVALLVRVHGAPALARAREPSGQP